MILSFAIAPGLAHTFGACVLSEQSVGGATPTEGVAVMATVGLPDAQGNRRGSYKVAGGPLMI